MMDSAQDRLACDAAILFATQPAPTIAAHALAADALGLPPILLPVLGKPLLQRAVEQLVRLGVRHIHVVLGEDAASIRRLLQAGERWGCRFDYHYLDDGEPLARLARRLRLRVDGRYWLAEAAQLPAFPPAADGPAGLAGQVLYWVDGARQRWTGWGLLAGRWLLSQENPARHEALEARLLRDARLCLQRVERPLCAATLSDLLDSGRRLLEAPAAGQTRIARGSSIHPSARLLHPVYVGPQVRIGAGAVVGPNAVVEAGAFVDRDTRVQDSLVMPDTYVGRELEMRDSIARGSLLANIRLDAVTEVAATDLLAEIPGRAAAFAYLQRFLAGGLRLALLPLYGLCRWQTRRETGAPGAGEPGAFVRHFCRSFYPGLREVMRGRLSLLGPAAQPPGEADQLPQAWGRLYGERRCGLLNEALLEAGQGQPAEDRFASDALAIARQGDAGATAQLLRRYLSRVLRDSLGGTARQAAR